MSDVKAAIRALRVFETYAAEARALSLSELAQRLDVPPSSCLMLIRTLLHRGYLYEAGNRFIYYPTRRMLEHATRIASHDPVVERLAPALSALRDRTQETVALSKLQGTRAIYLAIFDSPHVVRPTILAGTLRPLHSTSTGKALLGGLEEVARATLLEQLDFSRFTPNTLKSRSPLEAELRKMATRGWYSNEGETIADLSGIAVPVRVQGGGYAITVFGPTYRLSPRLAEHAAALRQTALELERERAAARPPARARRKATRRPRKTAARRTTLARGA
jgi:DNA-binding IclR family transcriptional regulator